MQNQLYAVHFKKIYVHYKYKSTKLKSISFTVIYINLKYIYIKIFLYGFIVLFFLVKYQGSMIKHRYRKLNYKMTWD